MPHAVDIHVGKRLRQQRTMLAMSQESLARAVDITFQQVQKYERGVNRMGASRLWEFSRILKVPVNYFFEGLDDDGLSNFTGMAEEGASFQHEDLFARKETMDLVRAYYGIHREGSRRAMLNMIREVSSGSPVMKDD